MIDSHTKGKISRLCGILIFTLVLVTVPAICFDYYYDLNDDTTIKDILSGAYTGVPNGYAIQMLYPLSWFIAILYKAVPQLPWYGLFLCVCQYGVLILIAQRLIKICKNKIITAIALTMELLVALGLFLRELIIIQYSVTSAFCMVGALFLFMTTPRTDRAFVFLRKNIISVILVIVAFMIRTEVCIMLMPFLLLVGMSVWGDEERMFTAKNFRKYIILIMSAILGMLVVFSLDRLAYSSGEWGKFLNFFDSRTELYDFYGVPSYEENIEFYEGIGLSKESYILLENYNFAIDDSIDSWMLESIAEYQKERAASGEALNSTLGFVSKNSVGEAIWLYKEHMLSCAKTLGNCMFNVATYEYIATVDIRGLLCECAVIGAYIIYIFTCLVHLHGRKKCFGIFKIIFLVLIRSILWLYLFMVDRVLGRVTTPLLMMELCVLIGFILNDKIYVTNTQIPKDKEIPKVFSRTFTACVIMITGVFLTNAGVNVYSAVGYECTLRNNADYNWNSLMEYCKKNGDNYYIIDVYSSTSYNGAAYSEKIFKNVDNSYKNYDICGGWLVKSPLTKQKMKKSGLTDVKKALYNPKKDKNSKKTYFIAAKDKDLSWLVDFYAKRGQLVTIDCVDNIYGVDNSCAFNVYELK